MRNSYRPAFTLVELLVVIAIIGILVGMLFPAIQAVREAARRSSCQNNSRQIVIAMHDYESAMQEFPRGFLGEWEPNGQGCLWSYYILPYIEQSNVYDRISPQIPGPQWAAPGGGVPGDLDSTDQTLRQIGACEVPYSIFRCPSTTAPQNILDVSMDNWVVQNRATANYLANCSGVVTNDQNSSAAFLEDLDGMFMRDNPKTMADAKDGTSSTIFIGEAEPVPTSTTPGTAETAIGANAQKDHWVIGSDDLDTNRDMSECFGSTAVGINLEPPSSPFAWPTYEISYGSNHAGGANFSFGDSSTKYISDQIDQAVFSALGTRKNGEVVSDY